MDPITAIAVASTAYNAIKKGFQVGKEVESMAGDLGRWMNAINAVKTSHSKAKGRRFGSVEEEALETFAAKKKAEQMENDLRNYIVGQYGVNAWQDIIRIQADLRKKQKEEELRLAAARDEFIYNATMVGIIILFISLIIPIIWAIVENS
jgi:ABC-type transport system involved in cytochrome c biogenesis permease subunit